VKIRREPLVIDSHFYADDWDVPRAAGCHLMQVVEYMERELQIADPTRNKLPPEALEWYRFGGFLMEHAFARHAIDTECRRDPTRLQRPDPVMWCLECDLVVWGGAAACLEHCRTYGHHGIHASPDAMMLDEWKLKEWKCTWKSQNRAGGDDDEDRDREHLSVGIWRWPTQTKAYAYLMQTLEAELWAMFVNGKYAPPVPSGDRFVMAFEERELEGTWSSVVSYARKGGML
jgi:hypothetical protein